MCGVDQDLVAAADELPELLLSGDLAAGGALRRADLWYVLGAEQLVGVGHCRLGWPPQASQPRLPGGSSTFTVFSHTSLSPNP